jgi:hypothetical protein
MITKIDNKLIFVGLFIGKEFFLKILLRGVNWLPDLHFGERYPKLAWISGFYTFSQIILVAFSIIFIGRSFQSVQALTFFVFLIFVPVISVDILKAAIEMIFSVSSYSVPRRRIGRGSPRQFYFVYDKDRVRMVGFVRLGINIGLLMVMIYVFL